MPRFRIAALAFLLLLPLIVFHRSLFFGEAFVPADLLSYLAPWKAAHPATDAMAPWNVLRFDGVAQFYPWRVEVARQMRAGHVPLWNPYEFGANGGTPLLANSQSAPLYPLHVLFYLVPPGAIWYVFGLLAALHLLIAGTGLYALLRACGLRRGACCIGAATWTLSAPVICWLSLPSFLSVSCWLPWLLLLIRVAHTEAGTRKGRLALIGAGGVTGTLILAGHLQIALYALLAGLLYALFQGIAALRSKSVALPRWVGGIALVAVLGISFAAPQVLPAVELSKISHRAVTEKTMELYGANNGSALPPRSFITLLAPDFYGNPNRDLHWNNSGMRDASGKFGNNYGEWAVYVGVLPLLLAVFALALPWRGDKAYFGALALVALLIATGTPLNLFLFYVVPGYASLANPGRVLTVFAFAVAALSAFGIQGLLDPDIPLATKRRAALIAVFVPVLLAAWGASLATGWAREAVPQQPFANLIAQEMPRMQLAGVLLVLSGAALFALPKLAANPERAHGAIALCALLCVADLAFWGYGYNPSSKPELVYPVTPGIAWLQQHAQTSRIAVLNRDWTLGQNPPQYAALPPNALTVYGLHDIAGYDSLFPKVAKDQVAVANGTDASPPANGNMVFVKSVEAATTLGAAYIVVAPDSPLAQTNLQEAYHGDDLVIFETGSGQPIAEDKHPVPSSFRIGLFLALCGATGFTAVLITQSKRRAFKA